MSTSLHPQDLRFVVSRVPKDIRQLMLESPIVIGGGFIRETVANLPANDIDVFGPSGDVLNQAASALLALREGSKNHFSKNAITQVTPNRMPVQFITRWVFDKPEEVIQSFDFTVCQAAIWFDRETDMFKSAIGEDFYRDLAAKRLSYTYPQRSEDAGGSLMRLRKFLARGYTIQVDSLAGVIARFTTAVRWADVQGDEAKAAFVMRGLLREVDPLMVIDGVDVADDTGDVL